MYTQKQENEKKKHAQHSRKKIIIDMYLRKYKIDTNATSYENTHETRTIFQALT